jgi:hypothetical protein
MGLAIRKENVTPNGIPASTNPINKGTEEQEQKGVIAPSPMANILATNFDLPRT